MNSQLTYRWMLTELDIFLISAKCLVEILQGQSSQPRITFLLCDFEDVYFHRVLISPQVQ